VSEHRMQTRSRHASRRSFLRTKRSTEPSFSGHATTCRRTGSAKSSSHCPAASTRH
jgi:hypothetical protein